MIKKKHIALVTWIGGGNFGTALQSFSLHYYLERKGYKVTLLRYIPRDYSGSSFQFIKSILTYVGVTRLMTSLKARKLPPKEKKFNSFVNRYYNLRFLRTEYQFDKYVRQTSVFITGSDQIWNTYYKFDPKMFLDFVTNKRKVAYASSIGTTSIKEEYKEDVKRLLLDFHRIGVREKAAVGVLSELTNRDDIVQVLDPTFLIKKEEWISVCENAIIEIPIPEEYICCYLIGNNEEYKQQLEMVKQKTRINKVIIISSEENPAFTIDGAIIYNNAGPLEFVRLIADSSFVCTDSFHATALSINLNKNFVEFLRFKDDDKASQNSRIYDVLSHYHLKSHLYNSVTDEWLQAIDYTEVGQLLEKDRDFSYGFLTSAIEE